MMGIGKFGVAGLAALALAGAVQADTVWKVDGTFQDGGALSGRFTLNVYGFLSAVDISTGAAGGFAETHYALGIDNPAKNDADYIQIDPGPYDGELRLNFDGNIRTASGQLDLLSTSFECQDSQSCSVPSGALVRYLQSGLAINAVSPLPEPASWALLIAGFGLAGAATRTARRAGQRTRQA